MLVYISEYLFEYYLNNNREEVVRIKNDKFQNDVSVKFEEYKNSLKDFSVLIENKIHLSIKSKPLTQTNLFNILDEIETNVLSINIYDSEGKLIAWKNSPNDFQIPYLTDSKSFSIYHSNIYKFLLFNSPIKIDENNSIFVTIFRILDYNFPISNRFLSPDLHRDVFIKEFEKNISIRFPLLENNTDRQEFLFVPLRNIDNSILGYAYFRAFTYDDILEELKEYFDVIKLFLFFFFTFFTYLILYKFIKEKFTSPFKEILIIISLWGLRYSMLFIGVPSNIINEGIFNPYYFASNFGYGIAKSIGEFLITNIFLSLSIYYLYVLNKNYINKNIKAVKGEIKKLFYAIFLFIVILLLFRGYIAIIISAVKDSNLDYFQPINVIPTFELIVMLVNLIIVTFSLILLILALINISKQIINVEGKLTGWLQLFCASLIAIILYDIHPNALIDLSNRVIIFVFLFILSAILTDNKNYLSIRKNFMLIVFSIIFLTYNLGTQIEKNRKLKLLDMAIEVAKPFDDWMAFLVDEAISQILRNDLLKNLQYDNKQLAFNLWAGSILSQKGYDCKLTVLDTNLYKISTFNIGSRIISTQQIDVIPHKKVVNVRDVPISEGGLKYYSGYAPIKNEEGKVYGVVLIELTASRSELLNNNTTNILTAEKFDRSFNYYKIYYSEYLNGKIAYTTNPELAHNQKLPTTILTAINSNQDNYFFIKEKLNDKIYESIYIKEQNGDVIFGISAEIPDWKKFEIIKLLIYLTFLSVILLLITSFKEIKLIYKSSFYIKTLIAFMVVSLIPLMIYVHYINLYTTERMQTIIKENLQRETEVIIEQITNYNISSLEDSQNKITDEICEEISRKTGIDFNFYTDSKCIASSLPELLQADLISELLSTNAFKKIILEGRQFFVEPQRIGSFNYFVGYRPLFNNAGNISGVVSVLTMSKMNWLEEEIAQRNIYMFGIYFIVFVFAFGISMFLSNQMSKPLKKLLGYTKQIADGNLDIKIGSKRIDEIGKLENAFDEMTYDLKHKREELIKYEKEIAWREMAKQVAHEIKNPLTPIKLSIQQLYQAYKDGAKNFGEIFKQAYDIISEQIETLNRIASEFSNFARMPIRKFELLNINEILDEAVQLYNNYPEITFIKNFHSEDLKIKADRDEIKRAFINIVKNSIQAIKDNGIIEITTKKVDDKIEIYITDNGSGITDDVAKRIFEPNFSTKSDGMGLGLAIVKKTIEDLNGEISFTTKVGIGTTFKIILKEAKDERNSNN